VKTALLLIVLVAAWLVSGGAYAQIQYQAGASTGTHTALDGATVAASINVRLLGCEGSGWSFYVDGVYRNAEFGCPYDLGGDGYLLDTTTLTEGAHVITAGVPNSGVTTYSASFTVDNILDTPPAAFVPPTFRCLPLPKLNGDIYDVPSGVSMRFQKLGIWTCDTPTSIYTQYFFFSWAEAAAYARRVITLTESNDVCKRSCVPLTASEVAFAEVLLGNVGPRAKVSTNGTSLTRPTYAKNADGTRNTLVRSERVLVGAKCNQGLRLKDTSGAGTSYFSVKGLANVATSAPDDVVGDLYALCTLSAPLGLN
jgi:hypothetical protein